MVADSEGNPVRAMDTAESGYGLQLIGAQYESEMWRAARQSDPLLGAIRSIPMTAPVTYVPIDGALPEMLLLGESTTAGASAYTTSKTPTSRATLTAKKFGINQIWSGELDQDSIIAFTPFLRIA
jgi:HK97 family phage major capsid protein